MAKKKSDGTDDIDNIDNITQSPPDELKSEFGKAHVAETDAATRLRAFEDEHLGPDAVRIGGHVERGVGSPYSRLNPARHRHYEALEKAVASEQKLAAAHAALIQADADHEAVMAELAAAEGAPDDPAA